jgi:membrane-bound ClpP family serine protease
MNLKRTFGAILTVLGIIGLIYAGIGIIQHNSGATTLIVVGAIALLFFFSGISLVRTTTDQVK